MPGIPSYLLKKVYKRGSLRNVPGGFELALKSSLAPATILGLDALTLDGGAVATHSVKLHVGAKWLAANEITVGAPLQFALGELVTLRVEGRPLTPGRHDLTVSVMTREAGRLDLPVLDSVAG